MKEFQVTDHFGNSEVLELGTIDIDYDVVPLTISNDTDEPIRIMLNKDSLVMLACQLDALIQKL